MPGSAGDLYAVAKTLLDAAAAALEDSPGGPLVHAAAWPGAPAFDCPEALYVYLGGPSVADTYPLQPPLQPMQRSVVTGQVDLVLYTIQVTRCVPVIEQDGQNIILPPEASVEAASRICYGDAWAIWNYLTHAHREGLLFQTPSGRREFDIQPVTPLATSGGIGGFVIPCRVQVPGYRPNVGVLAP